jgi:hypothetical protein
MHISVPVNFWNNEICYGGGSNSEVGEDSRPTEFFAVSLGK